MYSAAQWQLPDWLTEVDGISGNFTSDKFTRSPFLPLSDRRRKAPPHSMKCNASNYKHVGDNRLVILRRWACDAKCIGPIEALIREGIVSYFAANRTNKSLLSRVQKWDTPAARMATAEKQLCRRDELLPRVRSSRCCSENPNKKIKILQLPAMSVWAMY
jgi:hypothetical protein